MSISVLANGNGGKFNPPRIVPFRDLEEGDTFNLIDRQDDRELSKSYPRDFTKINMREYQNNNTGEKTVMEPLTTPVYDVVE